RAHIVGLLADLEAAFRVRNDLRLRVLLLELVDVLRAEHLVHGAEALPQQYLRLADLLGREPAHGLVVIPHGHLVERDAQLVRSVAAKVLVREEQHLLAAPEGPLENARRVGGGADYAAMPAAEGLQVSGGIDV